MSIHTKEIRTFSSPDVLVGESNRRNVYGYKQVGLVVKTFKDSNENVFPSAGVVTSKIQEIRDQRNQLTVALADLGTDADFIPMTGAVVHRDLNGNITYSETQSWVYLGKPLAKSKRKIFTLPRQSLQDLKNLFTLNARLWRKEGIYLDVVGSTVKPLPAAERFFKHLLPLFFSYNIVLDQRDRAKLIDIGQFNKAPSGNPLRNLRQNLDILGSIISLALIDVLLVKGTAHTKTQPLFSKSLDNKQKASS